MAAGNPMKLARQMTWAARIICLIITVFGGTMLIGEAVTEFISQGLVMPPLAGGLLVIIGTIALAGCVLSWRRELPAGILLVITSAALGTHIGYFAGHNHVLAWSMLGLPYLISGVLLIYAWRLSNAR